MASAGYNLYKVTLDYRWPKKGYETSRGFIVCCKTKVDAQNMHPSGFPIAIMCKERRTFDDNAWPTAPEEVQQYVTAKCIGVALQKSVDKYRAQDDHHEHYDINNMAFVIHI